LLREVYLPALAVPFREGDVLRTRRRGVLESRTVSVSKWFSAVRWQLRKLSLLRRYGAPTVQ
jgi:hypothetical protein